VAIVDGRMREEGGNKFNYILLRFVVAVFSFFPSSFSGSVGDGYDDPDVVFERGPTVKHYTVVLWIWCRCLGEIWQARYLYRTVFVRRL